MTWIQSLSCSDVKKDLLIASDPFDPPPQWRSAKELFVFGSP